MSDESSDLIVEPEALPLLPREICEQHCVVPLRKRKTKLVVATPDHGNLLLQDELRFLTQYDIELVAAPADAVRRAIDRYYNAPVPLQPFLDAIRVDELGEPVVRAVNVVLLTAIKKKQQLIAIEPGGLWVWRGRWVREDVTAPPAVFNAMMRRLAIMANSSVPPWDAVVYGSILLRVGDKDNYRFLYDATLIDGTLRFVVELVSDEVFAAREAAGKPWPLLPEHEPVPGWPYELDHPYR